MVDKVTLIEAQEELDWYMDECEVTGQEPRPFLGKIDVDGEEVYELVAVPNFELDEPLGIDGVYLSIKDGENFGRRNSLDVV